MGGPNAEMSINCWCCGNPRSFVPWREGRGSGLVVSRVRSVMQGACASRRKAPCGPPEGSMVRIPYRSEAEAPREPERLADQEQGCWTD